MKDRYQSFLGLHTEIELGKLSNTRIAILGAGAGSPLAQHLAREGVGTGKDGLILIADPGTVSSRNLGRQFYFHHDVSANKAQALGKNITAVNPDVKTIIIQEGVTLKNVSDIVNQTDVIVEMVDVAHPDITLAIHDAAKALRKPVVTGLDLGDDCLAYYFDYRKDKAVGFRDILGLPKEVSPDDFMSFNQLAIVSQMIIGKSLQQFSSTEEAADFYSNSFFNKKRLTALMRRLTPEMQEVAKIILSGELDHLPQSDVGGALLAALHAKMVKHIVLNKPVREAPVPIRIHLSEEIK